MAPLFIVRKAEKREVYDDDDLSAGEDSSFDGLQVPTPVKKRRVKARSLFANHLSLSTLSIPNSGDATKRPADVSPTGGFLNAFNNLIRSPKPGPPESIDSLLPPTTRPRARTAPTTPSPEALNAVPIELPTEVHTHARSVSVGDPTAKDRHEEVSQNDVHLSSSAWFRKPRVSSEGSERAVSPLSPVSAISKELSPRTRPPVSPQKEPVSRSVSQRVRSVEHTLNAEQDPVSRDSTPPLERQAPRPIAMPSWPVSGASTGLLGPLPPGTAAPRATHFPLIPKTPFFVTPRSNSMPLQRQSSVAPSTSSGSSPLRLVDTTPPVSSHARPPSLDFDISALRASHTSYIANLNENHTREVSNLNESHAREVANLNDAHLRESASLRTHIALLEKQAALPRGQHLSPSGLLPLLNTSPPPVSRTGSDSGRPKAPVNSAMSSVSGQIEEAVGAQKRRTDEALADVQMLQTTIKRFEADLSHARSERDILAQTIQVKDQRVKQMLSAMTRAAEKENELKTETAQLKKDMADVKWRLESATNQNLDYLESLQEATSKTRTLVHKESTLRKEIDTLKSSPSSASSATELESVRTRLREAEEAHADIQVKLTLERNSVSSLESKLSAAEASLTTVQTELTSAKQRIIELEKRPVAAPFNPCENVGMITIANALPGRDTDMSPMSVSSTVGHFDLLRREVRNLHVDERAQLVAFMRCLDDNLNVSTSTQTDAPTSTSSSPPTAVTTPARDKDRERSLRAAVRKLESERDQLSNLLSIEIRRAARMSAKTEDLGFGGRLERYDSIRSRVGSLDRKVSAGSLESAVNHVECDKRFEKARDMYEEEIRGLVKEIVLYKLDVKGYKKDLRRASSTISKLKVTREFEGESPMGSPYSRAEEALSAIEKPAPLRTRRSTTVLMKEKEKERKGSDETVRGGSVDGLGITLEAVKIDKKETPPTRKGMERPTLSIRAMTFDASPSPKQVEGLGRKDSGLGSTEDGTLGRNATVGSQRSGKSVYGKDRNSVPPDVELGEEELRPLSTVAEVGSAVGVSPGS